MRKSVVVFGLLTWWAAAAALGGPRAEQWRKVEEAVRKGLPKTAIEQLEPILAGALQDKAYGEAIKALGQKIALEGNIQGNKPEEKIIRLQAELTKQPAEMKPVLEAILANWYWHYFQHNRWRFLQRTQTAEAPGPDLQTWDLPRILAEIDKHFTAALADEKTLKATPVAAYDDLLVKGSLPDACRPTMFDFLVYDALQFYCAGEQGAVEAEDKYELSAAGPIFDDAKQYLAWWRTFAVKEFPDSPAVKALDLFGRLLDFHRTDADPTAFAEADLARLTFGHNKAVGEDKNDRYKAALQRFVDAQVEYPISARALAAWAAQLHEEGESVEARRLAQRGLNAFPDTPGAALCFNLIQQIEAPSVEISTERAWTDPLPAIQVTYRNVTRVFFRVVSQDFDAFLRAQRWGGFNLDDKLRKQVLAREPVLAWNAALPATTDYRERTEALPAPKGLKPGFYFILASHDPAFGSVHNVVSYTPVWVSDLALVMRMRPYENATEGFVLRARSGAPVAGASVREWTRDREGWFKPVETMATDENGLFRFQQASRHSSLFTVTAGDQEFSTLNELWSGDSQAEVSDTKTVFFTDRALYRPGQAIHYKGIALRFDQPNNNYAVLAGQQLTVQFCDPNDKEIARVTHVCNDYGSFSGTFTAPRDRVMGQMHIQILNRPSRTYFSVEEYKRPKFQVEVPSPAEAAKLNAEVRLTGKALAYTGAAIGGAQVKWRVEREVLFPYWCWWGWWFHPPSSQAIAHGVTATAADGTFPIRFEARPDASISPKDEPIFIYHVHADVTDSTGETRTGERQIRIGYAALQAAVQVNEWQTPAKPVELTVEIKTLDGEPQAVKGTVSVHRLQQPDRVVRPTLAEPRHRWYGGKKPPEPKADPADPNTWELGEVVSRLPFKTGTNGEVKVACELPPGIYRAMLATQDRFGQPVTARRQWLVVDPKARKFDVKLPNLFAAPAWELEPGAPFTTLWGTGYDQGRAFIEIEHRGKLLRGYWTGAGRTQELIEQAVTEEFRGGFTVRATYVRENRAYLNERIVQVPWSNKELTLAWEHFTSKLEPGRKETWTAVISEKNAGARKKDSAGQPDAAIGPLRLVAEMVAGLYDASLDQYRAHDWVRGFDVFRHEVDRVNAQFENSQQGFQHLQGGWNVDQRHADLRYRTFPQDLIANLLGYGYFQGGRGGMANGQVMRLSMVADSAMEMNAPTTVAAPMPMAAKASLAKGEKMNRRLDEGAGGEDGTLGVSKAAAPKPDLDKVAARKNLNETAFFFPHLLSDQAGVVRLEFTTPEALTEWKFLGFAHDQQLRGGYLTGKTVTSKDVMVEPNPPRFVREGDVLEFTVKVSNTTTNRQTGKVKLTFADARTLASRDAALGNAAPECDFDVPGKEARSYAWRISVPDGCDFLTYKAVGATAKFSDGEEGFLPVLSRRILVQESLPLPIRGAQTKKFEFAKLLASGASDTLHSESLTVQMVSQPAWYAVMALPYLMEFPHECSEQVFNRLYANALARHIANSDPKIRRIFDLWKNTPALDSPLEKNQDLKSVMLEETPWLRQAKKESQARRDVGILFDANRLNEETDRTLRKLAEMQLSEGLWPWFPGGRPCEYISLYIVTGFGRLRHLGVDLDVAPAVKALDALDGWVDAQYREILKHGDKDKNHLSSTIALYLYGRSFFLEDRPLKGAPREAVDYWLGQARTYWLSLNCRQSQAHLAIAFQRFGDATNAVAIMKSIKERSVSSEELGLFWRDLELSWWWYHAPIETQALMVEAFAEVMKDDAAVEDCKVWLLKQKQTQNWRTTKATADAVYALLLRGANLLASDALVAVSLGGQTIKPEQVEAGTGFYEQKFVRGEIKPDMGYITVTKTDAGVSWGSVHWQYLEDMTKVTPHEGTPLKLKKTLFVKETTVKGQVLKPVTGPLHVGDELVVRVELRTDRDMEYVHLKDQRGSGTEPVNVLSRYKYQDGLAYYESTRDTASHFFIDYLPKGVYVFEYSTRVQLKGRYQTGIAHIECMYAPEFNSHSESFTLDVK